MKKLLFLLPLLTVGFYICAQKGKVINPKKDTARTVLFTPPLKINSNINMAPSVQVFEKPNYQGRVAAFSRNAAGKYEFPFPVQHVSVKIPDSLILYVRTCFEFPSENAYTGSQADINLETLCGIRTDIKARLRVTLNGISTAIHNNDCMRFAGKVEVQVMETAPDAAAQSQMRWTVIERGAAAVTTGPFIFPLLNYGPGQLTSSEYAVEQNRGFVFNNNPVPNLTEQAHYGSRIMQNATNVFIVGRAALQSGRVKVVVKTDLTSAHKSCDLCDDFSANVKMAAPGLATVPFNKMYDGGKIVDAAHPYVVLGPYHAHGSRAGFALTASSGTDKDFRVHLKVNEE